MNRVRYIDTFSTDNNHEIFNASLLVMCSKVFDRVIYVAGKSSSKNVLPLAKRETALTHITYRSIYVVSGYSRFSLILRYMIGILMSIKAILYSSSDEIIIFNYNNLFAVPVLNRLNKILKRKILIFCHGELELLTPRYNGGGIFSKSLQKVAVHFFQKSSRQIAKGLYFAVMGDEILSNLKKILPLQVASKFITIDHSYIFSYHTAQSSLSERIHIGCVGAMSINKGLLSTFELARCLKSNQISNISLSIVGCIPGKYVNKCRELNIRISENPEISLSREEFDMKIETLDYILYLYPSHLYKVTASGAIYDAINKNKPVIAFNNSYFNYLSRKFGAFGYLVNSVEDILNLLLSLKSNPPVKINFSALKSKLSPSSISAQLKEQLINIDFLNK